MSLFAVFEYSNNLFCLTAEVCYDIISNIMNSISEKLIELRIATRYACNSDNRKGGTVSLRTKLLYLLSLRPHTPTELMTKLCMVKSNLAILCNKAAESGLISKQKTSADKRVIAYEITPKGKDELNDTLNSLENEFKRILTSEKEYNESIGNIDAVLNLLSFL